jgi:MFS transporter, ACS family, hexuronate transporter
MNPLPNQAHLPAINPAKNDPWTGYEITALTLLGLSYGFAFFDRMAMTFLAPYVMRDLHLSNTQIGALGSGLSLTWALGAYLIGRWSDAVGVRKPFLLTAMVVFSLCSIISGMAPNFAWLLSARMVMGFVEGPFLPICLTIITVVSAQSRRGLNAGIVQNVFGSLIGAALAPLLLVYIADRWGWQWSFYVAGLPALILSVFVWRFIHEPRQPNQPSNATKVAAAPISALQMLKIRNIALCAVISCLLVGSMVTGSIFLPVYLTQVRGVSPTTMSWIMAILGLCPVIGGLIVTSLSDRIGRRGPMIVFSALIALCPLATLLFHGSITLMTLLMFCGWLGAGVFPLFMGVIPAETMHFKNAAAAMGLVVACGELTGGVFSPLLGGWAADNFGEGAPLWLASALAIAAGLLSFALIETRTKAAAEQPTQSTAVELT